MRSYLKEMIQNNKTAKMCYKECGRGGGGGSIISFSNVIRKTGTILVALRTFA